MKYKYLDEVFEITVGDDGTLDTLIIVNSKYEYRFQSDDAREENGEIGTWAIEQAIDAYLEDKEIEKVTP